MVRCKCPDERGPIPSRVMVIGGVSLPANMGHRPGKCTEEAIYVCANCERAICGDCVAFIGADTSLCLVCDTLYAAWYTQKGAE